MRVDSEESLSLNHQERREKTKQESLLFKKKKIDKTGENTENKKRKKQRLN